MVTKRSKRLEFFLSNELGWETQISRWSCITSGCSFRTYKLLNFCSNCGTKMPKEQDDMGEEDELELAIAFALGEDS